MQLEKKSENKQKSYFLKSTLHGMSNIFKDICFIQMFQVMIAISVKASMLNLTLFRYVMAFQVH